MSRNVLIAVALLLPAVWGWLAEELLRRIWPRRSPPPSSAPPPASPGIGTAAVDFQI